VANDGNKAMDVFLRDLQTGRTLLLSRTPSGDAGHGWSLRPFFSADGRSLFFLSHAPDLAAGDFNEAPDLFKVEILSNGTGPLLVLRRNLTTGRAQLLWSGSPGKRYAVEFTDEVGAGWTRLPGEFAAGEPVEVDPTASARRFFRVVEMP
jgi:Tol biopolymer transport system component